MKIGIKEIGELRKQTGVGMMDCKKALENSGGDPNQAILYLRKAGLIGIRSKTEKTALEGTIGHYIHAGSRAAVLVEIGCESDALAKSESLCGFAKDVAMHIIAANPRWISRDDVPQEIIDREKEMAKDFVADKPPKIVEKIIQGKLNRFFKEMCLMEQVFVKDTNFTITDLLDNLSSKAKEKIVIKRFVRYVVGG